MTSSHGWICVCHSYAPQAGSSGYGSALWVAAAVPTVYGLLMYATADSASDGRAQAHEGPSSPSCRAPAAAAMNRRPASPPRSAIVMTVGGLPPRIQSAACPQHGRSRTSRGGRLSSLSNRSWGTDRWLTQAPALECPSRVALLDGIGITVGQEMNLLSLPQHLDLAGASACDKISKGSP